LNIILPPELKRLDGKLFRSMYLNELDTPVWWINDDVFITLDFTNVKRINPKWARDALGYFIKYAPKEQIINKIKLTNISRVKRAIVELEYNAI